MQVRGSVEVNKKKKQDGNKISNIDVVSASFLQKEVAKQPCLES